MSSADEPALSRLAAQGDRDAFGEIVRRHQSAVFNAAWRVLGDLHEAEDAAQETFLRAYQFFDRFDPGRPLGPWLRRIAVNVCLNRLEARKPASSLDEDRVPAPDPGRGPEAQIARRELGQRIRAEMLTLPPRQRAVIELRHFQELSYEEIAETLKRPLSDVKSDLFRARKTLAERLKDVRHDRAFER